MERFDITRAGVVVPVAVGQPGSPTPKQARGRRWRRTGPNRFVPADVDPSSTDQRIVEAVTGAQGCAATGWAALHWLGSPWFEGRNAKGEPLPVPLASGDRRSVEPRRGAVVSEDWLFADDIIRIDGLPITVPERSVSWEVRRTVSIARAVQVIDMAAASDLIDLDTFGEYVARLPSRPGIRLLRLALGLAEENVWSPMESEMRVLWRLDANKPRPLCNTPIFNLRGTHLLTPDLFDPVAGVAGEYDGALHAGDDARARDLDREERARHVGIELVTMMAADRYRPGGFFRRLAGAYERAAARPSDGRPWTIEQPEWWVDTSTVLARRALTADQRARWLRGRA